MCVCVETMTILANSTPQINYFEKFKLAIDSRMVALNDIHTDNDYSKY